MSKIDNLNKYGKYGRIYEEEFYRFDEITNQHLKVVVNNLYVLDENSVTVGVVPVNTEGIDWDKLIILDPYTDNPNKTKPVEYFYCWECSNRLTKEIFHHYYQKYGASEEVKNGICPECEKKYR